jgi:transcriptional regulator GlxA family with amidase domain
MNCELIMKRSLNDWARISNLSRSRMCHLFKTTDGVSPGQYLKGLRLETARTLLETTSSSVQRNTSKSWVADQSHFVRDFNNAYGLSAVQYRAQRSSPRSEPSSISEFQDY